MFKIFRGGGAESGDPAPSIPGHADRFRPPGDETWHRVVRTGSARDATTGARVFRSAVGVSAVSVEDAERMALERARRAAEAAVASRAGDPSDYAYAADRRLEPIVELLRTPFGDPSRVTVNGYGALVLNATAAMFVDIDLPGRGRDDTAEPPGLAPALAKRPELGFRLYRTRAGLRLLCTTATFDPQSDEAQALLAHLGADPKYVLLCRVQRCFRARLTPKPWRAGERPLETPLTKGVARNDLQGYVDRTWGYATARFLRTAGGEDVIPEVRPIVEYHDRWTQAASTKPLA